MFAIGLGINLTNNDPLQRSPFVENIYGVSNITPPASNLFLLLDDGSDFLLLDDGSDLLLLDA